ncbi:MAG TPA: dTMP kinase [Anaerolineales bacterium]|nr:dTMP kinase [Anaerolineales bacterium]
MKYSGIFITLEGPEGSGKTSHMDPLAKWLQAQGRKVLCTREPGGTPISEQIRAVIHDLKNQEMHPHTETLLYQAARSQIVEQLIKPELQEGAIVLCDRFADSTLAYQGYGHQQDLDQVRTLIHYATSGLKPDLTILLDLDVEIGLQRGNQRRSHGGEWNRLDEYDLEFHKRVRQGYLELLTQEPDRWVMVDASLPWQEVQDSLREVISGFLRK